MADSATWGRWLTSRAGGDGDRAPLALTSLSDEAKSTQLTTTRHQLVRIYIVDVTKLYMNDINTKKLMSYGRGLCGLSFV